MPTEETTLALKDHLFADETVTLYAVLDGASIPDLREQLYALTPEHACLYRGELEPDMEEVAPYLVRLDPDSEFADWIITKGWGRHWGVFAASPELDLQSMRRHFRKYLRVYDPEGKAMLFRYYDPRVLRLYLPTCDAEELKTVFGPVACFMLEDEDPKTLLRFQLDDDGTLAREASPLEEQG